MQALQAKLSVLLFVLSKTGNYRLDISVNHVDVYNAGTL